MPALWNSMSGGGSMDFDFKCCNYHHDADVDDGQKGRVRFEEAACQALSAVQDQEGVVKGDENSEKPTNMVSTKGCCGWVGSRIVFLVQFLKPLSE